jgi:hypothetical protein
MTKDRLIIAYIVKNWDGEWEIKTGCRVDAPEHSWEDDNGLAHGLVKESDLK